MKVKIELEEKEVMEIIRKGLEAKFPNAFSNPDIKLNGVYGALTATVEEAEKVAAKEVF